MEGYRSLFLSRRGRDGRRLRDDHPFRRFAEELLQQPAPAVEVELDVRIADLADDKMDALTVLELAQELITDFVHSDEKSRPLAAVIELVRDESRTEHAD